VNRYRTLNGHRARDQHWWRVHACPPLRRGLHASSVSCVPVGTVPPGRTLCDSSHALAHASLAAVPRWTVYRAAHALPRWSGRPPTDTAALATIRTAVYSSIEGLMTSGISVSPLVRSSFCVERVDARGETCLGGFVATAACGLQVDDEVRNLGQLELGLEV